MKQLLFCASIFLILSDCTSPTNEQAIWEVPLPESRPGVTFSESTQWEERIMNWNTHDAGKSILFKVPQGISDDYKYLICELYHEEDYSLRVGFNFFDVQSGGDAIEWQSGDNVQNVELQPRIGVKIGIIPGLKTNAVFPLSHLDGQEIFLKRFPRQLKGTVSGRRIPKENVVAFSITIDPFDEVRFHPEVQIKRIYFSTKPPELLDPPAQPVVDKFGQWASRDFKGKVMDEGDLIEQFDRLEEIASNASFPEKWSKYGGWKYKQFEATGFFYLKEEAGRWWMVDPDGYAFVSVGVDCMRSNSSGWITGQEDMFDWLPAEDDTLFGQCYSERNQDMMFDFFKSNLIRVYGSVWEEKWQKITVGLMKAYGINTIGNWSDMDFVRSADMPYVYPLSGFPSTETLLYRDFPDVYAQEYEKKAVEFASQLEPLKDDPYMIGYFLRNEPHWAFGKNNVAFEMFATAAPSKSKMEFVKWIAEKYGDIQKFTQEWNLNIQSFDELNEQIILEMPSDKAEVDFWDFSKILVRKYVDVVCDEVEKIDDNHLNLGMRYAWISSDLLYEAGERFDVFSINGYRVPFPPETADVFEKSGKPVMIGEFHFGSIDRGLPSTGITGVSSQAERGKAYRNYVEHGLSRNELIGVHYFQWLDQPIFGRFDGENYNIGVLTITHTPYEELVEAMKETNLNIYEIATGEIPLYDEAVDVIPPIYF